MLDKHTTVLQLRERVARFIGDRDWAKYHNPKDVAISMCIECSELLQLFQWRREEEIDIQETRFRKALEEELADILIYAMSLANATALDLSTSIINKIKKNEERYPVKEVKGKAWQPNYLKRD